ncbi:MAG: arginine repressor [Christensenellales bacterium]
MTRNHRQKKILDIVREKAIETQGDLVNALLNAGFCVTQATVSRDIKELGLIKVQSGNTYRYSQVSSGESNISDKLKNVFKESVLSITSSLNLIVIKTLSGSASAAAALVDKMEMSAILGCIAGDDTILVIIDKIEDVNFVLKTLREIAE